MANESEGPISRVVIEPGQLVLAMTSPQEVITGQKQGGFMRAFTEHRYAWFALLLLVACELALLPMRGFAWPIVGGLVALPAVLSFFLAQDLIIVARGQGLRLHTHACAEPTTAEAVQKTWSFERDRYRRTVSRSRFYAAAFGLVATILLTCSVLLIQWRSYHGPQTPTVQIALTIIAATATAFLVSFAKVAVRLSGYDFSARAFSWHTRSLVFSVVAAGGLALAIKTDVAVYALLLGVVAAVAGEHAMTLFLDKAPKVLGLTPVTRLTGPSPLLSIEGILGEHVERFEEEGVLSIHDLALVPTARLFFNTPYGLPRICDWQDQALLRVLVGPERAKDLFNQMGIRGAIALREMAEKLLADPLTKRDAFRRAMRMDQEAPVDSLLGTFVADEATKRLEVHRQSVVREPAQIDPSWRPEMDDDDARAFTCNRQGTPLTLH